MSQLNDTFTSTGHKFFAHQEAMEGLRDGRGYPIVTHVMLTDTCQHTCAFCSVQSRVGDSLYYDCVLDYLDILREYGLKAVILSGGGNPILYRCKQSGKDFNDVVDAIHARGLEIGLITNGVKLREYIFSPNRDVPIRIKGNCPPNFYKRMSWATVSPYTLDKLKWIRISMAGLDHAEREVCVPDVDPDKTTLGFSYVAHDVYDAPEDPHHGKVSTRGDLLDLGVREHRPAWTFESRIEELRDQFIAYCERHQPRYLRLLPNCLEPSLIQQRCDQLQAVADVVNHRLRRNVVFIQNKPPRAPRACYLGYVHPVLNSDGYVYPCDSCVLNEAAGHQFANPWRVCHWSEVRKLYEQPVRSLIADPARTCPGCVFPKSNEVLESVVLGTANLTPPEGTVEHVNFV